MSCGSTLIQTIVTVPGGETETVVHIVYFLETQHIPVVMVRECESSDLQSMKINSKGHDYNVKEPRKLLR